MKFSIVLWALWIISISSLILSVSFFELSDFLILMSILGSVGIQLYYNEKNSKIANKTSNLETDEKIKSIEKEVVEKRIESFNNEIKFENYKKEQEKSIREISKKIFELDNKFTGKFETLGKAVIKLSKDKKN